MINNDWCSSGFRLLCKLQVLVNCTWIGTSLVQVGIALWRRIMQTGHYSRRLLNPDALHDLLRALNFCFILMLFGPRSCYSRSSGIAWCLCCGSCSGWWRCCHVLGVPWEEKAVGCNSTPLWTLPAPPLESWKRVNIISCCCSCNWYSCCCRLNELGWGDARQLLVLLFPKLLATGDAAATAKRAFFLAGS